MKINITDSAKKMIEKTLEKENIEKANIRIYIQGMGWGGPTFGIALDEQKENDYVEPKDSINYVVEKELLDRFGGFEIDYSNSFLYKGFRIRVAQGGSTCS